MCTDYILYLGYAPLVQRTSGVLHLIYRERDVNLDTGTRGYGYGDDFLLTRSESRWVFFFTRG
jgi:hypothetical protein